jgi:hypothetical protein
VRAVRAARSGERTAAGATLTSVWVVNGEALLLNGVGEVDGCALEVRNRHLVDYYLYAIKVTDCVTVEEALVEVELVDQAGTTAWLHCNAKAQVVAAFLLEKALDLASGEVRQKDAVGSELG